MFRFIELFLFLAIVYIIANLIHYILMRITGERESNWLFGLSSGWLKAEDDKNNRNNRKDKNEQKRTSNRY